MWQHDIRILQAGAPAEVRSVAAPGLHRPRPATGRPRQASKTFVGNTAAAERALRGFVAEVEAGKVDRSGSTLAQFLDEWLDHIEPTHRPKTVFECRRWIDTRIRPTLGAVELNRLVADQLDRQYRAWLAEGLGLLGPSPSRDPQCLARSGREMGLTRVVCGREGVAATAPIEDTDGPGG